MVKPIQWDHGVKIVEFGPGTGPFTQELLDRLPGVGRYLGIERDPVFLEMLRSRFPEAEFLGDSVENLLQILEDRELFPVDHIVSGLPFASFPTDVILRVLDAAESALSPGGTFTTFQYLHAYGLPSARFFRKEMARRFGRGPASQFELRNIPPAFVFTWRKLDSENLSKSSNGTA